MSIINNNILAPLFRRYFAAKKICKSHILFNQHIPGARILKQNNGTQGLDYKAETGCP
jgi:hypothetical protein